MIPSQSVTGSEIISHFVLQCMFRFVFGVSWHVRCFRSSVVRWIAWWLPDAMCVFERKNVWVWQLHHSVPVPGHHTNVSHAFLEGIKIQPAITKKSVLYRVLCFFENSKAYFLTRADLTLFFFGWERPERKQIIRSKKDLNLELSSLINDWTTCISILCRLHAQAESIEREREGENVFFWRGETAGGWFWSFGVTYRFRKPRGTRNRIWDFEHCLFRHGWPALRDHLS